MAIILNSLQIDPGNNWKGIWRWYDDFNLNGLDEKLIMSGMNLRQWHELAMKNNLRSLYFYPKIEQNT